MALLTTEDVLEKTFNIVKFREGYDQVEVDDFLDEVVSTIYTLQAENQNLREQLEAAERRVAELSGGEAPSYKPAEETAAPVVEEPRPLLLPPQLLLFPRVQSLQLRCLHWHSASTTSTFAMAAKNPIASSPTQTQSATKVLLTHRTSTRTFFLSWIRSAHC